VTEEKSVFDLTPELLARVERLAADRSAAWFTWNEACHRLGDDHPETRRCARECRRLECVPVATYGDLRPRREHVRDEIDDALDSLERTQAILATTDSEGADLTKAIAIVRRLSRELNAEIPPRGPSVT
jgi:hypothetical protein